MHGFRHAWLRCGSFEGHPRDHYLGQTHLDLQPEKCEKAARFAPTRNEKCVWLHRFSLLLRRGQQEIFGRGIARPEVSWLVYHRILMVVVDANGKGKPLQVWCWHIIQRLPLRWIARSFRDLSRRACRAGGPYPLWGVSANIALRFGISVCENQFNLG